MQRKAAQEKLSDYIESAAIFLGTPGNTVAGWMKQQRTKRLEGQGEAGGYQEGQTATGPGGAQMVFENGTWRPM